MMGDPLASGQGVHRTAWNFSSDFDAKSVARSSLPSRRKLITNAPVRLRAGSVRDVLSMATSISGGSVESPTYAWLVSPRGSPLAPRVVTMLTPDRNELEIARHRSRTRRTLATGAWGRR